jgi:hypothetical protein
VAIVSVPHSSFGGAVDVSLTYDDSNGQLLSVDLKAIRFSAVTVTVASLTGTLLRRAVRVLDASRASIDVRDLGVTITATQTRKGASRQISAVIGAGWAN